MAMSGGVDSSVAAAMLVEAGHEVVGATLRTFCYTTGPAHAKSCCGLEGVEDARGVARALGIPHTVYDVEEDFTRDVIDDFVEEYSAGRTPNPCVRCNSFTKFRDLLARARVILSDSGGIQEEAPSLGKPVLVAREATERPEGLDAGNRLVGRDADTIYEALTAEWVGRQRAETWPAPNPFGDGTAGQRIAEVLGRDLITASADATDDSASTRTA